MERLGPRELEELGHDARERMALRNHRVDDRLPGFGTARAFQELRVSEDRRESVAELMRDSGRHFAQSRQILLQEETLAELDDLREIGEKSERPSGLASAGQERDDRDSKMERATVFEAVPRLAPAVIRPSGKRLFHPFPELLRADEDVSERPPAPCRRLEAEDLFRGRVDHRHPARGIEAHETRGHAADDVGRERLGLVGARFLPQVERLGAPVPCP